ncbi:chorismate--pyruvate lyase family protein [Pseudoduganella chitinolytica]|uniref:Probable chorismate pyruvate-lyase n=1 Tax=Pseudoduganella chitinolytica TaxID=34070 RepID=A0ABY8B5P4_9BURK|nr:chorismate lyase [Pseudoduganella chitinolytica]WEF31205.1 chorismate lyase [Pseudoduganella chitinolytica]
MRERSLRQANWVGHVLAVNAPPPLRHWLTAGGSLTAKLKSHADTFRVQVLHQHVATCLSDEARAIGLHRPGRVWEREVLLRCDNAPVVFAHTVVPMSADATDWPLFSALGERSLGTTLFGDPRVTRGTLEYARLRASHPLALRARAALAAEDHAALEEQLLYARRCLYRRRQGTLLVTEVFLPRVTRLVPRTSNTRET